MAGFVLPNAAADCECACAAPAGAGERHPLLPWLEAEVKERLLSMERKLDHLTQQVDKFSHSPCLKDAQGHLGVEPVMRDPKRLRKKMSIESINTLSPNAYAIVASFDRELAMDAQLTDCQGSRRGSQFADCQVNRCASQLAADASRRGSHLAQDPSPLPTSESSRPGILKTPSVLTPVVPKASHDLGSRVQAMSTGESRQAGCESRSSSRGSHRMRLSWVFPGKPRRCSELTASEQQQPPSKAVSMREGLADMEVQEVMHRTGTEKDEGGASKVRIAHPEDSEDEEEEEGEKMSFRTSLWSHVSNKSTLRKFQAIQILRRRTVRSETAEHVWNFMEDPESSKPAHWYGYLMTPFTILAVCVTLLQTFSPQLMGRFAAGVVEIVVDVIFLLEFLLRFMVAPNRGHFMLSPHNIIDFLAVLPLTIRIYIGVALPEDDGDPTYYILLCFVPTLRLLKTLRRFRKFTLLLSAFLSVIEVLPVLLFTMAVLSMVFAAFIFLVEPRENIPSLPIAMWLALVTMTTVGYGDVAPETSEGRAVVSALVIISVLYMAMPIGIIGHSFTCAWQDRHRILLLERTRERLVQWRYTAKDIPVLFDTFDVNKDGRLDKHEFRKMLHTMGIDFHDHQHTDLFEYLDDRRNGAVSAQEFVHKLFPSNYAEVYGHPAGAKSGDASDDGSEHSI